MKKTIILVITILIFFSVANAQSWHTFAEDSIYLSTNSCPSHCPCICSIYVINDSILIGGAFNNGGEADLECLGLYANNQWEGLGVTDCIGQVMSVVKYKEKIFVGGTWYPNWMSELKYLSYWDGSSWNPPGDIGGAGTVSNFKIHNDTLFVCGAFTTINGVSGMSVMAYDNNDWINIGSLNVANANVLEVYNGDMLCGTRYLGIYKRTGATNWEHLPGEPSGSVNDMVVDSINNLLYIGGVFHYVDNDIYSRNVAMWDGFKWHSLDSGVLHGDVIKDAMAIYRGDLYIGGVFDSLSNGLQVNHIARWDGNSWYSLGNGCSGGVEALAVFQDTLIIGGGFYEVGDSQRALAIAKWHIPDTGCNYLRPILYAYEEFGTPKDTFQISNGEVEVNFYNNNAYADSWEWDFTSPPVGGSATSITSTVQNPVITFTETGEYNVQVTVTDGECVKTANRTIYIEEGSGIVDCETIDMQIFPNPSNNNFTVKLALNNHTDSELRILDSNGKLISKIQVSNETTSIPTKGWTPGTYICNLFVDRKLVKTEKLIYE